MQEEHDWSTTLYNITGTTTCNAWKTIEDYVLKIYIKYSR